MLKPLVIKNLNLKSNLILAPMAKITNYPFRKLMILHGADLVTSEMISSKSIFYGNKKSLKMAEAADDRPLSIQIFGGDTQSMVYAAVMCEERGADMIEINAGCPVKKVVKAGGGLALFSQPKKLAQIIYEISKRIKIPISVKMRLGIKDPQECIEVARICQESGADIIHLHMRLASQMHSGAVDFKTTMKLKSILRIPLIANGGIRTPHNAVETFNETKADAISIAQGAIYNPFIFDDIKSYILNNKVPQRTPTEKLKLLLQYLDISLTKHTEKEALINSRRLIGMWFSGFPHASKIRDRYLKLKTIKEAKDLINEVMGISMAQQGQTSYQ